MNSSHTSEDGAELLPAGDAALRGELTKGDLQEENWETSTKQENEVGDEKCTWVEEGEEGETHLKQRNQKEEWWVGSCPPRMDLLTSTVLVAEVRETPDVP